MSGSFLLDQLYLYNQSSYMCMLVQRAMQGERSHVRKQGPKYELFCSLSVCVCVCVCVTCEATGLCQKECAPRHEEEQSCLQQLKVPQLGEFGHVTSDGQGVKQWCLVSKWTVYNKSSQRNAVSIVMWENWNGKYTEYTWTYKDNMD